MEQCLKLYHRVGWALPTNSNLHMLVISVLAFAPPLHPELDSGSHSKKEIADQVRNDASISVIPE
jgi:hypothetical protein